MLTSFGRKLLLILLMVITALPAFAQNFTFQCDDTVQTANYSMEGNIFYVYFGNNLNEPNTLIFDLDTTGIGEWLYAWCVEYCFPPWVLNSSLMLPAGEDSVLTVDIYPDSTVAQTAGTVSLSAYSTLEPEVTQTISFTVISTNSIGNNEVKLSVKSFGIDPPYPNPFNPDVSFIYHIDAEKNITVSVYNSLGQTVKTLFQGSQSPGSYRVIWDGMDGAGNEAPGAVYYISVKNNSQSHTVKAVKIK